MNFMRPCPECGTALKDGTTCRDYFDKLINWDFEDFMGVGQVHHLTVLCYYLQHPNLYSPEGLNEAKKILKDIVENKTTIQQLYKKESDVFSSDKRTWNVSGTPANHASYSPKIIWSMTASDIVATGVKQYPDRVKKWAQSIYTDLKMLGT